MLLSLFVRSLEKKNGGAYVLEGVCYYFFGAFFFAAFFLATVIASGFYLWQDFVFKIF